MAKVLWQKSHPIRRRSRGHGVARRKRRQDDHIALPYRPDTCATRQGRAGQIRGDLSNRRSRPCTGRSTRPSEPQRGEKLKVRLGRPRPCRSNSCARSFQGSPSVDKSEGASPFRRREMLAIGVPCSSIPGCSCRTTSQGLAPLVVRGVFRSCRKYAMKAYGSACRTNTR
jgi:hypothetical protein